MPVDNVTVALHIPQLGDVLNNPNLIKICINGIEDHIANTCTKDPGPIAVDQTI